MSDESATTSGQSKLLIDASDLAKMLSISRTSLFGLKAAGRLPKPIRLGRSVRWNIKEIEAWVDSGCPPLHRWETMRVMNDGRSGKRRTERPTGD